MKHGQIATKELAEFVRERAAIEETYSKSMNKLAKMASNSSQLGTFAPMWDVFRVSCDKLALCHLELMRKMNDLIRDINKYGEEQVKIHRKTKEEVTGTLEAVQNLQVSSSHLQKSKENYHSKCLELERLRREGAPQKELEKAESKSKKAAESFSTCVEKYNRVGGDFQQKMSESAQKFQSIEEAHLRQMKLLIKSYSHSIEDTHVQVGQVHEEFKQNVENIGIENLIQKFAEQKGTGKERPASVGFEEYSSAAVLEVGKKIRNKAFRIPGLGKREKEPDSTLLTVLCLALQNSPEVDAEGFVIRADINQNDILSWFRLTPPKTNFYSSDSDFDDDEPKKFHIQIRPVASGGRHSSAAAEQELKATVGALTLPPQRGVSVKRHLTRNSSSVTGVRSGGEGDSATQRNNEQDRLRRCTTSSPEHSRISSTVPGSETLFGPPLDSAFKPNTFAEDPISLRGSLMRLSSSTDAAFSSDSSSPENVEDSGLDSPSHPPLGPSPEPCAWAAWPGASHSKELGLAGDPFLAAFRDPFAPAFGHPSCSGREPSLWAGPQGCKHIPPEDPFLVAIERTLDEPWDPPPRPSWDGGPLEGRADAPSDAKAPAPPQGKVPKERGAPSLDSPEDPFSITMVGSPTHRSSLAGQQPCKPTGPAARPGRKELVRWNSVHNPFAERERDRDRERERDGGRKKRTPEPESWRNGLPLTRHTGPQEDLCYPSAGDSGLSEKEQACYNLNRQASRSTGTPPPSRRDISEVLVVAPPRPSRSRRAAGGRLTGSERVRPASGVPSSLIQSLSRGPSPISLSTQEAWPVAAAITEYINAYFKGGEHNRCLVKITGDLTMSFPAGITRVFTANPNAPVLSFRLVNIARVDHFLPNQKLLYSDPSQSDPETRDFWFNMQALQLHLQREAELNPQASYYNVGLLKYQVSSQDPGCAPLLLSAECQRSGTVTRVSLDYHCCPATAPASQLSGVQVVLPLEETASDVQCQPPGVWNADEHRLLWKLPNISPTADSKGSGTLCASWQCLQGSRASPPNIGVQFLGSGASLSGLDIELVGSRYRMSLVKKRFATVTLCEPAMSAAAVFEHAGDPSCLPPCRLSSFTVNWNFIKLALPALLTCPSLHRESAGGSGDEAGTPAAQGPPRAEVAGAQEDKQAKENGDVRRPGSLDLSSSKLQLWTSQRDGLVSLRTAESGPAAEPPVTVDQMFRDAVRNYGDQTALGWKEGDRWSTLTYEEYYEKCKTAAKSFLKLGLERYHGVGILGFNSAEWFISDIGAILAGGFAVGIYTTNSPEACQYVVENSKANILVVENHKQLQKILQIQDKLPRLKAIVQYKDALKEKRPNLYTWAEFMELGKGVPDSELEEVIGSQKANQCCTLIYTSGTTGQPKGVMLSHDNLTWTALATARTVRLTDARVSQEVVVSYLPLSHIAAQMIDIWLTMRVGGAAYFAQPDALKGSLANTLREVRPTAFMGVPRVWEKMQEKMKSVGAKSSAVRRKVAAWAKDVGLQTNLHKMHGHASTPLNYRLAKKLVFKKVRKALGLDRCTKCYTGAAPITKDTLEFFLSLDIPVYELYGMSESTGPHTISLPDAFRLTSCGKVIPGCETKIFNPDAEGNGEICFWGRHVFMGYLGMEDKTEESLDTEGWLHSGDLGKHDQNGFLFITGRIKELIITAGGENIPPVPIEDAVKETVPIISNAMLIGDKKKFLSMLLTIKCNVNPDTGDPEDELTPEALDFCQKLGSTATKVSDITGSKDRAVYTAIQEGINRVNEQATSNAQKIQKWTLLERDFSIPGGELGSDLRKVSCRGQERVGGTPSSPLLQDRIDLGCSDPGQARTFARVEPPSVPASSRCPTMKLKRPVVMKMYKDQIDSFYKDIVTPSTPDNPLPPK
ncbi:ACBG2 ligase, partial [Atractosteus spatula]|nr:ACBG2 ligase [Atractosteus spatula]